MSKDALIYELTESRNRLYTVLSALPEESLHRPNAVDGYSIAEICGLISAWEDRLLTAIQQISQGDVAHVNDAGILSGAGAFYADDRPGNQRFNAAQIRKRRRWPWRDLLQELVSTREETGWTLANMPEPILWAEQPVAGEGGSVILLSPADLVRQLINQDRLRADEITMSGKKVSRHVE
jgi:hypothetical protein